MTHVDDGVRDLRPAHEGTRSGVPMSRYGAPLRSRGRGAPAACQSDVSLLGLLLVDGECHGPRVLDSEPVLCS